MRGRLISIATAGALLAVAAVAPALAGSHSAKRYPTTITITAPAEAPGTIKGQVKSDKKPCFKGREVTLNVDGEDVFSKPATSGGHYKFFPNTGPIVPGTYEVHSPKLRVSNKVVCKPGNSKILTIN